MYNVGSLTLAGRSPRPRGFDAPKHAASRRSIARFRFRVRGHGGPDPRPPAAPEAGAARPGDAACRAELGDQDQLRLPRTRDHVGAPGSQDRSGCADGEAQWREDQRHGRPDLER